MAATSRVCPIDAVFEAIREEFNNGHAGDDWIPVLDIVNVLTREGRFGSSDVTFAIAHLATHGRLAFDKDRRIRLVDNPEEEEECER